MVGICTEHLLQTPSLLVQLLHRSDIFRHIILCLFLLVELASQEVSKSQLELHSTKSTIHAAQNKIIESIANWTTNLTFIMFLKKLQQFPMEFNTIDKSVRLILEFDTIDDKSVGLTLSTN